MAFSHTRTLSRTRELSRWTVVLGQTEVTGSRGVSVEMIVVHNNYSRLSNDFDIAMLKLTWPVTVGGTVLHSSILMNCFYISEIQNETQLLYK